MPQIDKFTLESHYDSLGISTISIMPDTSRPKTTVQFIHGLCGCKERFIPAMEYLCSHGFACIAHDHRGHGESIFAPEDIGYMYKGGWKSLTDDMKTVSEWALSKNPGIPIIMIGHSMGALATKVFIRDNGLMLSGAVLCGLPSYSPFAPIGKLMTDGMCKAGAGKLHISLLQEITSGIYNIRFRKEGHQAWTCSDPNERERFRANPVCNFKMTASCASCVTGLMLQAYSPVKTQTCNPSLEIMLLSGEDDPCSGSPAKLQKTAARMAAEGYGNVHCRTYPSKRHELLNGQGFTGVLDDIIRFMSPIVSDSLSLRQKFTYMNENTLNTHNKEEYPPMHTAEHILNATMVKMFGCPRSRNAHIERKKSKCDYILNQCPTPQQVCEIENAVNRIIENALDVTAELMPRAEAESIADLGKLPEHASDTLRIVRIGDYDTCACIGAHVNNTSEIGKFTILSHDYTDGRWRVRWKVLA